MPAKVRPDSDGARTGPSKHPFDRAKDASAHARAGCVSSGTRLAIGWATSVSSRARLVFAKAEPVSSLTQLVSIWAGLVSSHTRLVFAQVEPVSSQARLVFAQTTSVSSLTRRGVARAHGSSRVNIVGLRRTEDPPKSTASIHLQNKPSAIPSRRKAEFEEPPTRLTR